MLLTEASLVTTLLGLAGTFLGLAVLVQVVQEVYKYITSSKGRAYTQSLIDFLGPWAMQLMRPEALPDMRVRGPFQLRRLGPKGMLLPLEKAELISGLERTSPPWVTRALECLKLEQEFQSSGPLPPSQAWQGFLSELGKAEEGSPGYWNALAIAEFLELWNHKRSTPEKADRAPRSIGKITPPKELNGGQLMSAFRKEFLRQVDEAAERFPQLESNFEYTYQRRNTRQTFMIAFVIALLFNLPIEKLYHASSQLSPEEATSLAQNSIDLYNRQKELKGEPDSVALANLEIARRITSNILRRVDPEMKDSAAGLIDLSYVASLPDQGIGASLRYLFGCLMTSLLVSFGAPFWNDLASALLRLQKTKKSPITKGAEGDNG